jgi:hypothetical protein
MMTIESIKQEKTLAEIIAQRNAMILEQHNTILAQAEKNKELEKTLKEAQETIQNMIKENK